MRIPMPPKWFNPHGLKMEVGGGEPILSLIEDMNVVVGNNTATLQILCEQRNVYRVRWIIRQLNECSVEGTVRLSKNKLKDAFGLPDQKVILNTDDFAMRFEADTAMAGLYIRKDSWLNIPMPGTGLDGDPNISVFLTHEIITAVRDFINSSKQ